MRRVFKYPLLDTCERFGVEQLTGAVAIEAPPDAEILSVGLDPNGKAVVWAAVHPQVPTVRQPLLFVGTGDEVPEDVGDFIGTVVSGPLVGHLFRVDE